MNSSSESFYIDNDGVIYTLQGMFYLLLPSQTYFETLEEVPKLVNNASNFFAGFVILEYLLLIIKNGWSKPRINDGLTSVGAGLISRIPDLFCRSVALTTYCWFYENFCIYELPWNSFITYFVAFMLYDLGYYWFHRAAHEINIFWAAHQVHHSSEDYNLTTALRQSVAQAYTSWMFYLPMALFVPPSIFKIHSYMNLLYQFWIHTELIETLGPIEYIFNTPSHHRVHHGRNAYCIDKNYAGVLIIWDRIFGTFQAEKRNEQVAFGLVHNVNTFHPIYIQFYHFQNIFKKFMEAKTWNHKLSVLFKGPGWAPGLPRLGDDNFPAIEYPIQKYDPKLTTLINVYMLYHFLNVFITFAVMLQVYENYDTWHLIVYTLVIVYNFYCFGAMFDQKPYAVPLDCSRCLIWIIYDLFNSNFFYKDIFHSIDIFYILFKLLNILSLLASSVFLLLSRNINEIEKKYN